MPRTADPALKQLREICLDLPDAHEVPAWGTFTWRTKKIFAMYAMPSDSKHSGGRPGVWLDKRPPWKEIAALVEDSWRLTAPKRTVGKRTT